MASRRPEKQKILKLNKKSNLKAIDFFCGAGGVTAGFIKAGINVLAGIDIDQRCQQTYELNNGTKFIHTDISSYQPVDLANAVGIDKDEDNLIFVGCSPCQYYTIMNTDKEKSAKSKMLLEDFMRFVDYFNPGYVFIENVPGLKSKIESPLKAFKCFLNDKGYIYSDSVKNAVDYGVPQNRKRYVLIATRIQDKISLPDRVDNSNLTVRNYIGNSNKFPIIQAGHKDLFHYQHTCAGLKNINILRLMKTSHDGGNRLEWKDDIDLQLNCYKGKDEIFYDVYGRMFWDKPAPTITTKFYSISNGRFAHPEQNRAISLREGATLQTFDENYFFYADSIEVIARMIGNAVPPKMAELMGQSIINSYINAAI